MHLAFPFDFPLDIENRQNVLANTAKTELVLVSSRDGVLCFN